MGGGTQRRAMLLLIVPVFAAVWQTDWDTMTGWRRYAFVNKRWLAGLYGVAIATALVLPVWSHRLLWRTDIDPVRALPSRRRRWPLVVVELMLLLAAAWYLAGPPWNISTHHRPIDFHEQVHLGPLQAIDRGYLPYVGPASTQYGPGAQLAVYGYMSATHQFNLIGFREAFLLIHVVCVAVFALLARAHGGWWEAWLILLIGLICSPLKFFLFGADGSPGESYGWGNAGRYLGAIAITPAAGLLLTRSIARPRIPAVALGIAAGVLAWFSQENLAAITTGTGLLSVLLLGGGAANWSRVRSIALWMGVGVAVVWVPLLAWYASRGAAGSFLSNYFLIPGAVAAGFQNTWFAEGNADPYARVFHYLPVALLAIGVMTLWDVRTWRPRTLDRDRIRLLSFTCALLASFQGALYRSDSLHTLNVLLALPFVVVLAVRDLPRWLADTPLMRGVMRLAIASAFWWLLPLTPQIMAPGDWILRPPALKYSVAAAPPGVAEAGVGFERGSPELADEPSVVGGQTGPMRQFLADASQLREWVGRRATFIEDVEPYYTGLVYFMADLTPAPYLYDVETMVFNDRQEARQRAHFEQNLDKVECVIASSPDAFAVRSFLARYPEATLTERRLGAWQIYVLMRSAAQ